MIIKIDKDKIKQFLIDSSIDVAYSFAKQSNNEQFINSTQELKEKYHSFYEADQKNILDFEKRKYTLSVYFRSLTPDEELELGNKYVEEMNQLCEHRRNLEEYQRKMGFREMIKYTLSDEYELDKKLEEDMTNELFRLDKEYVLLIHIHDDDD